MGRGGGEGTGCSADRGVGEHTGCHTGGSMGRGGGEGTGCSAGRRVGEHTGRHTGGSMGREVARAAAAARAGEWASTRAATQTGS